MEGMSLFSFIQLFKIVIFLCINIGAVCNTSDRSFTAYELFTILIIALLFRTH